MTGEGEQFVPNIGNRWNVVIYGFFLFLSVYLLISSWPPDGRDWIMPVGLVCWTWFSIRNLRSGIVLRADSFVSRGEFRTRTFPWDSVTKFEARGKLNPNQVGVLLTSGRWVFLQFHYFGPDYVAKLEKLRMERMSGNRRAADRQL